MKPQYFVALDGMRGIAAILVLAHHVITYFSLDQGIIQTTLLHGHFHLMVDCFLIISGFVIAHSFDAKMVDGMPFWRFLWSRISRLYPMVVLGTLFGGLMLLALWKSQPQVGGFAILWSFVSGIFLIPTTALLDYKPFAFPANSSNWSLSFEMLLCIFYALLFFRLSYRMLCVCAAVAAGGTLGVAYYAGTLDIGFFWQDYWLAAGRVIFPFLAGMIIRRSSLFRPGSIAWGYLGIPLLFVVACNPFPASWQYDVIASLFVLPLLIWIVASAKPLSVFNGISSFSGSISYPLYAIHYPFVVVFSNVGKILHLNPINNFLLSVALSVSLILLSFACQKYYDIPLRRRLGRLFPPKTAVVADSEPSDEQQLGGALVRRAA